MTICFSPEGKEKGAFRIILSYMVVTGLKESRCKRKNGEDRGCWPGPIQFSASVKQNILLSKRYSDLLLPLSPIKDGLPKLKIAPCRDKVSISQTIFRNIEVV